MANFGKRKGAVLIVVLGVLFVLALLATTFAALQATEKQVSRNYLDTVRAKLLAQSGAQHAAALIEDLFPFRYLDESKPQAWRFFGTDPTEGVNPPAPPTGYASHDAVPLHLAENPSFAVENESPQNPGDFAVAPREILIDGQKRGYSGAHETGRYGANGDQYALKVVDLSGRLYINDGMDVGKNGTVTQNMRRILNLLGDIPAVGIPNLGDTIIGTTPTTGRPPYGYRDIAELAKLWATNGEANLKKIREFVTVHAWVDNDVALPVPLNSTVYARYKTAPPPSHAGGYGVNMAPLRFGAAERTVFRYGPQVDCNNVPQSLANMVLDTSPPLSTNPTADKTKFFGLDTLNTQWVEVVSRAPVNVNSAPKEVLVALLADLRGVFHGERRRNNPRYSGDLYLSFKQRSSWSPAGTEGDESGFLRETFPILGVSNGTMSTADGISPYAIADEIIACRRKKNSVFRPSFNYANVAWSGVFKSWDQFNKFVDNLVWYDPTKFPQYSNNVGLLRESRNMYVMDYDENGCDATGSGTLIVSEYQRAMSSRAIADVLKANFNPNTTLNEINPDENMHVLVDKTDLCVNSTEFNFLPTGYIEVESLGRVLRPLTGSDCAAPNVANRLVAQARVTAIHRFYNLYRETSQRQFYKGTLSPRPATAFETNNNMTLEIGWEPDNGVFAGNDGAPGDPDNETGGYLALPTLGGGGHKVGTKPKNTLWSTIANSPNGPQFGTYEAMHMHFQWDQDCCNHLFERREIASRAITGEGVINYPDRPLGGSALAFGGPYNPTQPGSPRVSKSFRNPKLGSGTGSMMPASAGMAYAVSDLRIDGTYVERHAAPAYMLHAGASHVWDFYNVATQGMMSFWMKPSYYPEFTGKVRTMMDIGRFHASCGAGVNIWPLALWFFPAHYNPGISEGTRPDYWANNVGKFHPMSLCWGSKAWHDIPSGHGFGDMTRSLNHTSHPDDNQKPNLMKAHKWLNLGIWWNARNSVAATEFHRMWINGSRTYVVWNHGNLWEQTPGSAYGNKFHMNTHDGGTTNGNHLRLGGTSKIDNNAGVAGTAPITYRGNHSGDHTLDEFYAWQSTATTTSAGYLANLVNPSTLWSRGRYYNYVAGGGTGDGALPTFTSAPFKLEPDGGRVLPPGSSVAPPSAGTGGTIPPPGGTVAADPQVIRVLGLQWTWIGEPLDERITPFGTWDGKRRLYDYATGTDGFPALDDAVANVKPLVQVRLIDGVNIYGPPDNVEDYSQFMAIRDVNGQTPVIVSPTTLKYDVRFRLLNAQFNSILLATPMLDDVTIYYDDGGQHLVSYVLDNRSIN